MLHSWGIVLGRLTCASAYWSTEIIPSHNIIRLLLSLILIWLIVSYVRLHLLRWLTRCLVITRLVTPLLLLWIDWLLSLPVRLWLLLLLVRRLSCSWVLTGIQIWLTTILLLLTCTTILLRWLISTLRPESRWLLGLRALSSAVALIARIHLLN